MLPQDLAQRLQTATGISAGEFGTLRLTNLRTVGHWTIAGRDYVFAPLEYHLIRPEGFARKLNLGHALDANVWGSLIAAVVKTAKLV